MGILSFFTGKREPDPEPIQDPVFGVLRWHGEEWIGEIESETVPCKSSLLTVRLLAGQEGPSQSHREQYNAITKITEYGDVCFVSEFQNQRGSIVVG